MAMAYDSDSFLKHILAYPVRKGGKTTSDTNSKA